MYDRGKDMNWKLFKGMCCVFLCVCMGGMFYLRVRDELFIIARMFFELIINEKRLDIITSRLELESC